jgi:microcystin degradation protein MlrC
MRIFAGGVATETNTFAPMPTGLQDYFVVRPADLESGGSIEGFGSGVKLVRRMAEERDHDFVFGLFAFAQPSGTTVRAAYESLRDELLDALKAALPVDAVFLQLHGAMIAQGYDDCETDLVHRVRSIVGPQVPIGVELDLHCDVSRQMVEEADAIVLFKEYPHIDIGDRAADLFRLLEDMVAGKIKPTMAKYDLPMIGMYLTPHQPMRSFVDEMMAMEGQNGVLSVSLIHCFPWADVPSTRTGTLVITDNDPALAEQLAEELALKLYDMRHTASLRPLDLDAALDKALAVKTQGRPVVMADQADNAGGGAPSDSTFVLRALLEREAKNVALGMLWDPVAVQVAMSAGVGAELDLRLGGKMGPASGDPLDLRVTVRGLIPSMVQHWPQQQGSLAVPVGDAAWLECRGIDIIVNSRRSQVFGRDVFENFGIDLTQKQLVVVKSTQHFYAGYGDFAQEVIYAAAPGAVAPLFEHIPYRSFDPSNMYPRVDDPLGRGGAQ